MRTLHSCKRGSAVCFERVAALCSPKIRDTASVWYGAFITNVDAAAPWWIDGKTVRRAARAHAPQTALTVGENLLKKRAPPGRALQAVVPGGGTAKRQRIAHPPVPGSILSRELDPPSAFARDFLGTRSVLQYDKVRFRGGIGRFFQGQRSVNLGVFLGEMGAYVGERAGFLHRVPLNADPLNIGENRCICRRTRRFFASRSTQRRPLNVGENRCIRRRTRRFFASCSTQRRPPEYRRK